MPDLPRMTASLDDIAGGYGALLCDVWGVIHNGVRAFDEASAALIRAREKGLAVVLITNAPRPADSVQRQLRKMEISDETYDAIVSSGDLTASSGSNTIP